MSYLRKPDPSAAGPSPTELPAGGSFAGTYPAVWEYLAMGAWDDGSPRERSTLLIMFQDGLVKLCLTDKALERACWTASDDLDDALAGLEGALAGGTAEWRKKPPYNPKGPKRS